MQSHKFVSVIIPSKRENLLQRCLSSLEKQTYPTSMFEVIIVSLKPITNEAYLSIPVKTIIDEKANQAEARNIAEKIAKGEAKELLGWEPRVSLEEGLKRTIEWYVQSHTPKGRVYEKLLMERA